MKELLETLKANLVLLGFGALFVSFVSPFCILGWQVLRWLKHGYWPTLPASKIIEFLDLPYPEVSWIGVQVILDKVLSLPLALVLPLSGGLVIFAFGSILLHFEGSSK